MYSLIRVWIGLKLARIADPRQGRGQDHQRDRQPVGAELVVDAEERDPVEPSRRTGSPGDPAGSRPAAASETTQVSEREAERQRARARVAGAMATAIAPSSGRKMMIDRIGMRRRSIVSGRQQQVRAGHHDQPDGDAQGVVLDPAGLDLAQPAAGVDGRRPDGVDGAIDDLAVEPPDGRRDPSADDHEQQVVQVVEPPLVERRAVEERRPGGQLADALRAGRQADRTELDAEQPPGEDHADGRDRDAGDDQGAIDAEQLVGGLGRPAVEDLLALGEDRREPSLIRLRPSGRPEVHAQEDATGSPAGSAGWS